MLLAYIKPTDSPATRLHGQPKTSKPGVPVRPIVSYCHSPLYNLNKQIANILEANFKYDNNKATNSATFSNYIRILPIEENEIMVLFDATSLCTNNPIIDTLNKIKDYVNNDGQFTRKKVILQDKFLDLVNLFLTTNWYTFSSTFTNKLMSLQWEDQHLQLQHKFICRLMNKLQYLPHYTLQNFRNS